MEVWAKEALSGITEAAILAVRDFHTGDSVEGDGERGCRDGEDEGDTERQNTGGKRLVDSSVAADIRFKP
jgi:hypothetical protein